MPTTEQKVKEILREYSNWYLAHEVDRDAIEIWLQTPQAKSLIGELGGVPWVKASERLPENLVAYKPIRITTDTLTFYGLGCIKSNHTGPVYYDLGAESYYDLKDVEWLDESPSIEHGEAKDEAIGFAEWVGDKYFFSKGHWEALKLGRITQYFTTQELYDIYLKTT